MTLKREYIYIVNFVDDTTYMCKFASDIYKNCIDKDSITYDQFRYMIRKQNFTRLNNIRSIEKHNLDEYLAPYFEAALEAKRLICGNDSTDDVKLTIFIKNKIFAHVKNVVEKKNKL